MYKYWFLNYLMIDWFLRHINSFRVILCEEVRVSSSYLHFLYSCFLFLLLKVLTNTNNFERKFL